MKVVILAGGKGTRISEESQYKPKPMVDIGGWPIIWHIMKEYSFFGFREFIICAGYKQHIIKQWFSAYFLRNSDVTFDYSSGEEQLIVHSSNVEPWKVTIVDTGLNTMTGGRIKRIQSYIGGDEPFLMTYGDAVCDVDICQLVSYHRTHGKLATLTAVMQDQTKGVLSIGGDNAVKNFREKQVTDGNPINAGYMVFEPGIFGYLEDDSTILEQRPLERLAEEGQLMSYIHHGFWKCMDNIREREELEKLVVNKAAPWMRWEGQGNVLL